MYKAKKSRSSRPFIHLKGSKLCNKRATCSGTMQCNHRRLARRGTQALTPGALASSGCDVRTSTVVQELWQKEIPVLLILVFEDRHEAIGPRPPHGLRQLNMMNTQSLFQERGTRYVWVSSGPYYGGVAFCDTRLLSQLGQNLVRIPASTS